MRRSGQHVAKARAIMQQLMAAGEILHVTRVTVAELWVGIESSSDREAELQRVQRALQAVTVLEIGDAESEAYGRITAHLQRSGKPSGDFDVLIAAVALTRAQTLVTRNPRHFVHVPALNLL